MTDLKELKDALAGEDVHRHIKNQTIAKAAQAHADLLERFPGVEGLMKGTHEIVERAETPESLRVARRLSRNAIQGSEG